MDRIAYIGNEPKMIGMIRSVRELELKAVVHEEKKKELFAEYGLPSIPRYSAGNKRALIDVMKSFYGDVDYLVMYSFGIIIPNEIIRQIDIYNFHSGDLRTNRGSSPINWSILNNDSTTKMTLHKIDEEIDSGELISEHLCRIYDTDVPCSLKARMEGEIPSMLLELYDYVHKNRKSIGCISKGNYRKRITEADYTIYESDTDDDIKAKIRSQYDYEGAVMFINSKRMIVKTWEEYCEKKGMLQGDFE